MINVNDANATHVLASSTLCTVKQLEDNVIEVQIGAAVLRMNARDIASLTGTLQRVVKRVFVPAPVRPHTKLEVIRGGKP